jgi:hypothetical protein
MYPATAAAGGVALALVVAEREKEEPEQPERYNVSASAIQTTGVAPPEYAHRADLSLDMASTSKNDGWRVKGKRFQKRLECKQHTPGCQESSDSIRAAVSLVREPLHL